MGGDNGDSEIDAVWLVYCLGYSPVGEKSTQRREKVLCEVARPYRDKFVDDKNTSSFCALMITVCCGTFGLSSDSLGSVRAKLYILDIRHRKDKKRYGEMNVGPTST